MTINSRIVQKHAYEAEWIAAADFVPRKGELIIYDAEVVDENNTAIPLPEDRNDFLYDYARFKIGDGQTKINDLPFATDNAMKKYEVVNFSDDYPTKNQITALKGVTGTTYDLYVNNDNSDGPIVLTQAPMIDYEGYQYDTESHRPVSCKLLTEHVANNSASIISHLEQKIQQISIATVVSTLPDVGTANQLYLIPRTSAEDKNVFDEFLWINDAWEYIGTMNATVDLSKYATIQYVNNHVHTSVQNHDVIVFNDPDDITPHHITAFSSFGGYYDLYGFNEDIGSVILSLAPVTSYTEYIDNAGEDRPIACSALSELLDNKIGDIETILASI